MKLHPYQEEAKDIAVSEALLNPGTIQWIKLPTGCLHKDTITPVVINRWVHEYTIEKLYHKFNSKKAKENKTVYNSLSFDDTVIKQQQIIEVLYSGLKELWIAKFENGQTLIMTEDHEIRTTSGYIQLKDLTYKQIVITNDKYIENNRKPTYTNLSSVRYYGTDDTYDIVCGFYPNFTANGIIVHNSGKTITFSATASELKENNKKVLITSRNVVINEQNRQKFKMFTGYQPGLIQNINKKIDDNVNIANVMTLKNFTSLDGVVPDVWIIDEVQDYGSNVYNQIHEDLKALNPNITIIGYTATERKRMMKEFPMKPLYRKTVAELIDLGYLVPFTFKMVDTFISLNGIKKTADGYDEVELDGILSKNSFDDMVYPVYDKYFKDRKTLLFVPTIKIGENILQKFLEAGVKCVLVTKDTKKAQRELYNEQIRNGEINLIINILVYVVGFDEPSIDGVWIMRPNPEELTLRQMIGRGLRPYPNKDNCLVVGMGFKDVRNIDSDLVSIMTSDKEDLPFSDIEIVGLDELDDEEAIENRTEEVLNQQEERRIQRELTEQEREQALKRRKEVKQREREATKVISTTRVHWTKFGDNWIIPFGKSGFLLEYYRARKEFVAWKIYTQSDGTKDALQISMHPFLDIVMRDLSLEIDKTISSVFKNKIPEKFRKNAKWRKDKPTAIQLKTYKQISNKKQFSSFVIDNPTSGYISDLSTLKLFKYTSMLKKLDSTPKGRWVKRKYYNK